MTTNKNLLVCATSAHVEHDIFKNNFTGKMWNFIVDKLHCIFMQMVLRECKNYYTANRLVLNPMSDSGQHQNPENIDYFASHTSINLKL